MAGGRKLGFKNIPREKGGVPEKVAKLLGIKPKLPLVLVDDKKRIDSINLINFTVMIEENTYQNICRALQELNKAQDSEGLRFVASNTNSVDVCMAILNGDYPEEIKKIAEKKVGRMGAELDKVEEICANIKRLEDVLRNRYMSVEESAELLKENTNLSKEVSELGVRDLFDLATTTHSTHVCQVIANGNYPEDIRAFAERRMEQLRSI